jgi:hypothetical protein
LVVVAGISLFIGVTGLVPDRIPFLDETVDDVAIVYVTLPLLLAYEFLHFYFYMRADQLRHALALNEVLLSVEECRKVLAQAIDEAGYLPERLKGTFDA